MVSSESGDRAPGIQTALSLSPRAPEGEPESPEYGGPPSPSMPPVAATPVAARVPRTTADDWAICCSGGGVRSAIYCLGGLQSLDEVGVLRRARWIIGVSGGSYIAASRALVAHGLARDARLGEALDAGQARDVGHSRDERPAAYARGTLEEQNLRNNAPYGAPGGATILVEALTQLLGAAYRFILALAPLYALGHVWGWLLRAQGVLTWSGGKTSASVTAWTWWLAPAIAAAVTMALFVYWWATLMSSPGRGTRRARAVGWAATYTVGLAVLMLGVPPLIAWLYRSTGALGTIVRFFGVGGNGRWSAAALAGLIVAVVIVARFCQKQLARLRLPGASVRSSAGALRTLTVWARTKLTPWLTSLVIIAVGAFVTVLWIGNGARVGFSADQLMPVLVAVGIMLATRAVVDINRTSLHDFNRWQLADTYAVTRSAVQAATAAAGDELFAKAARTRFSELRNDQDGPQLVIACTANINANRKAPPGREGFCLAFAPDKVTLRADPLKGELDVEASTADYEHLLGHTRFTLFDVVAISGAAFSPSMGAATRAAYRIVLTLGNLRLGFWMPHPDVVRQARAYLDTPPEQRWKDSWWSRQTFLLLLWYMLPHPAWHPPPWHRDPDRQNRRAARQKERAERQKDREARLWAYVLELRQRSTEGYRDLSQILLRLQATVSWRVMRPTVGLLWAEAVGYTSYRARWINVTDGGHYDNLGLVDALHRGVRNLVVLDATGDKADTWFTLGGAMALATTEAGVDVQLDPTSMIRGGRDLTQGQVVRPWAYGTFTRPTGQTMYSGQTPAGNIWVCKLGWWTGAPWSVLAYAKHHPTYPCDSTLEQLHDATEFDAYHQLGAATVLAAAKQGAPPLLPPPTSRDEVQATPPIATST